MNENANHNGPPPFDRPFDGADTKQRIYGAILHAREPKTAAEIADSANCSAESARTHLSFYADLGIVIHRGGRPATYERNDDYFQWRRVNELTLNNTVEELQARVVELTDTIETYREQYSADSPADVDVIGFDPDHIDDSYIELGNWATALEERRLHERARRKAVGLTASSHG